MHSGRGFLSIPGLDFIFPGANGNRLTACLKEDLSGIREKSRNALTRARRVRGVCVYMCVLIFLKSLCRKYLITYLLFSVYDNMDHKMPLTTALAASEHFSSSKGNVHTFDNGSGVFLSKKQPRSEKTTNSRHSVEGFHSLRGLNVGPGKQKVS